MRKEAKDVSGFYVTLDTFEELPDGTDYRIGLLSVTPKAIADDPKRFAKVIEVTAALENLLKVRGITVVEAIARSAADVSLEDIGYYKRLEFDYISERFGGERPQE